MEDRASERCVSIVGHGLFIVIVPVSDVDHPLAASLQNVFPIIDPSSMYKLRVAVALMDRPV
jgi:hypothetical protein